MNRTRTVLLATSASVALVVGMVAAAVSTGTTAVGLTVPGQPTNCKAAAQNGDVLVTWGPPVSDGGDAVTNYTVKIKGQTAPVHRTDTEGTGGSQRSWLWTDPYVASSVFQVRAVNSAGFGAWCETPIGPGSTPTPTPTPTSTATATPPPGNCLGRYQTGAYLCSAPGAVDSAKTSAMRSFLAGVGAHFPKLNGAPTGWGMAYGLGTSSDPVFHLTGTMPAPVQNRLMTLGFHAPANMGDRLTGTTDSPFVIVDQATGISIWGAGASKVNATTIKVSKSAGYFSWGTNGIDDRRVESNCDNLGKVCEVSRGRIPDAFLVTAAEFATAKANGKGLGHVLEFFWPETDSSGCLFPMAGCEGGNSGWGFEGQRVALNPATNIVDRAGCTPEADVIVRTLQQNGGYIGDNAGGNSWVIKVEQNSAADPVASGAFSALGQNELSGCVTEADFVATGNGPFN